MGTRSDHALGVFPSLKKKILFHIVSDYLLSIFQCIELYTVDNGEQRVGFYSLEMATDIELEPKPYHVIAFEDVGDSKNMCYIIQAHMDMLGNGHAFVVPRLPKVRSLFVSILMFSIII
jgi:hypothetical protein